MKNKFVIKKTIDNLAYLNIGCGNVYNVDWNNIDIYKNKHVNRFNILGKIPYKNDSFDFVYSSHFLEHFDKEKGTEIISEIFRILKPGGIARIVVPDLETICKEYLNNLNKFESAPSPENQEKFEWSQIELLDQMVREKSGGLMADFLRRFFLDKDYIEQRVGDRAIKTAKGKERPRSFLQKILRTIIKMHFFDSRNPRKNGEIHKWMYDRISLKTILGKEGFENFSVKDFKNSDILRWEKYNLDRSVHNQNKPRKADSIYVEAKKPKN